MKDVCRLCLKEEDLVWIFDKRFENSDNMKDVIFITTGVEISAKDIVSQKICKTCCQVTIKMFEFRSTSLKNDQLLKEQCKVLLRNKEIKIPNTEVTIRSELKSNGTNIEETDSNKNNLKVKSENKSVYRVHPSVRELFNMYPEIKLPTVCLKYDITPCVSMKMDQVEQYFKFHNLDFEQHTKLALKVRRVATKKTSASIKPKNNIAPSPATIPKLVSKFSTTSKLIEKFSKEVMPLNAVVSSKIQISPPSPSSTSSSSIASIPPGNSSKKRKLSDVDVDCVEKKGKTNFIQSLGLAPNGNSTTGNTPGDEPSYVTNKSELLHVCDICNAVKYSAKDLRRHQSRHLRCQLCRMRFRNIQLKNEHLDKTCPIKNTMENLPNVILKRIELDENVRKAYPDAFESFLSLKTPSEKNTAETSETNLTDPKELKQVSNQSVQPLEIIEILSDEDEDPPSSSTTANKPLFQPIALQTTTPVQPTPTNVMYNTVSIVKPDIKIKGNNALDVVDGSLSDVKILKELLINYRSTYTTAEQSVQTDWPVNELIRMNRLEMSAELKQLKPQLHVYKIPIYLKYGPFNVLYRYSGEAPRPKQLCLWNDLKPIDVKPTSVQMTNEDLQRMTILPLPVTNYQSPQSVTATPSKFIRIRTSSLSPITRIANVINTNPVQDVANVTSTNPVQGVTDVINTNPVPDVNNVISTNPVQDVTNVISTNPVQDVINVDTYPVQDTTLSTVQATDNIPVTIQTLNVDATPSTAAANKQIGIIRVKNVWELT